MQIEHNLIDYALKDGKMAYIEDVENGYKCGCFCACCNQPLVAKNGGTLKIHHFAHKNAECKHAYETMVHVLAKEVFAEIYKDYKVPQKKIYYKNNFDKNNSKCLDISTLFERFIDVKSEQMIEDIIPDIILKDVNGRELIVEIKVTHGVDENKRGKIEKAKLSCVEFDLSKLERNDGTDEITKKKV